MPNNQVLLLRFNFMTVTEFLLLYEATRQLLCETPEKQDAVPAPDLVGADDAIHDDSDDRRVAIHE